MINEGTRAMTIFFLKIATLDLGPRKLKLELVQDFVKLNICVILNQNRSINEGTRAMTILFLKKIAIATLTLALERSNSNLSKILSY